MNLAKLSVFAAVLMATLVSNAAVLSVDINDASQPANTPAGFNALVTSGAPFSLLGNSFGGVTLTISGIGETLQSASRNSPTNSDYLSTAALYQDFIYGGIAKGNGLGISLGGLTPYQNYTVEIWSYDAQAASVPASDWTANGVLVADKFAFNPNAVSSGGFAFTVTASSAGAIYITGIHDGSAVTGAAVFLNAIQVSTTVAAVPNPYVNSWLTSYAGNYARIYTNNTMKNNGTSIATWSNGTQTQNTPAYAGVQEIYSSSNWLYLRSSGLASHIMGPWQNGSFPNLPINTKTFYRIPRTNSVPATKTLTSLGAIGYFVDGVAMFDTRDAFYWNGSSEGNGTGNWNREAYVNEGATFDPGYAHQPQDGMHHYHANPIALRYQLGDHVDFNAATDVYTESTNAITRHSPILGWVADGFPVYGPYGFSSASNSASGLRRMVSGYVIRNGQYGTSNLTANGRSTIPAWAARLYNVASNSVAGPAVNTTYPLGRYMEDNDYLGDRGYIKGTDFDLDEYNGRWCVTPEFPAGTYAYFVSISTNGTPVFPYNIGRAYYGTPSGGAATSFTEAVVTNFLGASNLTSTLKYPARSGNNIVLTWSGIEGGTYRVEAENSLSGSNWTTIGTNLVTGSSTGAYTETNGAANNARFYRVARTALAAYDPVSGTTGGGGGGGGILSVSPTSAAAGATFTLTINIDPSVNPPPANAPINSVSVGTTTGTGNVHVSQTQVTSVIHIPSGTNPGAQTVTLVFPGPPANPANTVTYTLTNGFNVTP